jgi:hypothetical protein
VPPLCLEGFNQDKVKSAIDPFPSDQTTLNASSMLIPLLEQATPCGIAGPSHYQTPVSSVDEDEHSNSDNGSIYTVSTTASPILTPQPGQDAPCGASGPDESQMLLPEVDEREHRGSDQDGDVATPPEATMLLAEAAGDEGCGFDEDNEHGNDDPAQPILNMRRMDTFDFRIIVRVGTRVNANIRIRMRTVTLLRIMPETIQWLRRR